MRWNCKKCDSAFDTVRALKAHRKVHSKRGKLLWSKYIYNKTEDVYICNICERAAKGRDEMDRHVVSHNSTYTCERCGRAFENPYKYSVHVQSHGSDGYLCPICGYKTQWQSAILQHINCVHLKHFMYNCKFCGKGTDSAAKHKEHEGGHEGREPILCVVCGKSFSYSSYLIAHQRRTHRVAIEGALRQNQCRVCRRLFSKPETLARHLKDHEGFETTKPKTHLCDMCGKAFAGMGQLEAHYGTHTGKKPFACRSCPKNFTHKQYLVMHERVHSGERPFVCEHCGKGFSQRTTLKIHVRGHTGERPYSCHICKGGFISRTVLNVHFKTCNG